MLFSMPATAYPRLSSGTPFHRITRSNITGHGINQLPAVLLGSRRCNEPRTSFGHVFLVSFYVMISMLDRIGLRRVYVRDVAQRIGPGTRRRRRKERSQAALIVCTYKVLPCLLGLRRHSRAMKSTSNIVWTYRVVSYRPATDARASHPPLQPPVAACESVPVCIHKRQSDM